MENNFNLKKFLVENKLTVNSRILSEASGKSEALAKAKASHDAKMSKLKGQSQGASGGVTRAREDKEIERYEKEVERINKKFTNNEVANGSSEASGKSEALAKAKASHNAKMNKLKGQSQGASGGVTRAREDKEIERYEKEVERINKKFTNNEVDLKGL